MPGGSPAAAAGEMARIAAFLAHLQARGRRPATITAYRCDWKKFAAWNAATNREPFDLARLVPREVSEYRSAEMAKERSAATINRALAFLVEYARWAAGEGGIRPVLAVEVARVPRVPAQALAPRGLSKAELRRFLKEVDVRGGARDRAAVYLGLFCGLRLGELARLRIEDLEMSERKGLVRIRSEWAKGSRERVVPIPAAARKVVGEYLDGRGRAPGLLFLGERGPIGRNGISRLVGKYAEAARVRMSPHTLRHCYAYRFLEATANDLVGLADLLGHANINTTRIYTRRRLEDLEAAVEGLDFA